MAELDGLDRRLFHPDTELCTRWMAARILELGWTKETFGQGDKNLREFRGQSSTEPIAKK